jgi:hypothetical protein
MSKKDAVVRIEFTEEQKQAIRDAIGKDLDSIELTAEALEDRIAPARFRPGIRR